MGKRMRKKNIERADAAEIGLEAWLVEKGGGSGDAETDLGDMLADLRHHAQRHGLDFEKAVESSLMHYEAERDGDE